MNVTKPTYHRTIFTLKLDYKLYIHSLVSPHWNSDCVRLQCYRFADSSWRARNDQRCKNEQRILDDVCRYFQEDVEVATEKLSTEEYDKFYDIFEDKDIYEYIPKLLKAL